MGESGIPRKRFIQGAGAAVASAIGLSQSLPASATTSTESQKKLPPGLSYAPGKPPKVLPLKVVRGVVQSVDKQTIAVKSGSDTETVPLKAKPFIWKDGPVQADHAAARLVVGEPVTISGVTDLDGEYLDIQHVWAGSAAEAV